MSHPLYIFDLDGTLSNAEHRMHWIQGNPQNWEQFYEESYKDPPVAPMLQLLQSLYLGGSEIRIWTGRGEQVRQQTVRWLENHTGLMISAGYWTNKKVLRMREIGDHTQDHELKRSWLSALHSSEWVRLQCAFEDRARVVQMYREHGVACCQVAPGDF